MDKFYLNSIINDMAADSLKRNIIEFLSTYDNCDDDILAMITGLKPVISESYIKGHYDELCEMLVNGAKDKIVSVLLITPHRRYFEVRASCLCEISLCFKVASDEERERMDGFIKRLNGMDANDIGNITEDYSRKSYDIRKVIEEIRSKFDSCNPDDEHSYRVTYLKEVEYSIDLDEREVGKV